MVNQKDQIIAIIIGIVAFTAIIIITFSASGFFRKEPEPIVKTSEAQCTCAQNERPPPDKNEFIESFPLYAFEIVADMVLAIILGLGVNGIANFIGKSVGIHRYGKLSVQLFLIIIVLYIMKIDSKYLYPSWKGQTGYGIIFTAIFLAVQKNITSFVENI